MSNTVVYLSGVAKWAKVHDPDTKFDPEGSYSLDLFLDDASQAVYDTVGLQLKKREEDGEYFYSFKRRHAGQKFGEDHVFGPPAVFGEDGRTRFTGKIGNGSVVTVKLEVYDSRKGRAHRLDSVRVDELVPYDGETTISPDDTIPF